MAWTASVGVLTVGGRVIACCCEELSRGSGGHSVAGEANLGAVLRELRTVRRLTLAAVARQAGCSPSTLSYVESGHRQLQPWLAEKLDRIYGTGGVVASLIPAIDHRKHENLAVGVPGSSSSDIVIVLLPQGGASMPLSRRELLTTLGIGIAGGRLQGEFERALERISLDSSTIQYFEAAFHGYQEAIRMLTPRQLMDGMLGNVAVLDGLRRRAPKHEYSRYSTLQARYAESLSWLNEEAGDLRGAMYWIDRASQWAQAANWSAMTHYSFVRRSMMILNASGDGRRAIHQARHVLDMPDSSPRMKGLAAKQMAFGFAISDESDSSCRALDAAMKWLAEPTREDDSSLGQRSVVNDDLFTIFQATCDIYLGRGARVISVLDPKLALLSKSSVRTATITRAKLARAYANAGQPGDACRLSWETLNAIDKVGSLSARSELRRTVRVLQQWHGRSDVRDITHRLNEITSIILDA